MRYFVVGAAAILAIALGVAGVVFGEADDSPGLQALGAALVIATIVFGVRTVLRRRRR
ncbi:hypothetical protein [Micromonospora avicenniae]|uniref:Uncharacterized protein n=1 Tax=Micromonospora avicenniae TaxID=1198245 RepID=A0A1N7DEY6_9ACTN|nr:hypothetical protein [Micromonospora avicenniae]SIR74344.1 hypothetical protein SAMN05444858_11681 [Micromonospora avicenniae]